MNNANRWERIKAWLFHCFPHHWASRPAFFMSRLETRLKNPAIRLFIRWFDVDMGETESSEPESYPSFNAFFTRALKPEARPVCNNPRAVAAPCDGTMMQNGTIEAGRIIQAKGCDYSTGELLGGCGAEFFNNGKFCTIYLSPRDCHRIHAPLPGRLEMMTHIPGRLFSVAPYAIKTIPRLYTKNERVACLFDTDFGKMAVVMVGAVNVSAIETSWHGLVAPRTHAATHLRYRGREAEVALERGEEMGRFNLGSSVVLLLQNSDFTWNPLYYPEAILKTGCELACLAEE